MVTKIISHYLYHTEGPFGMLISKKNNASDRKYILFFNTVFHAEFKSGIRTYKIATCIFLSPFSILYARL